MKTILRAATKKIWQAGANQKPGKLRDFLAGLGSVFFGVYKKWPPRTTGNKELFKLIGEI